jgi:hypothetical protein
MRFPRLPFAFARARSRPRMDSHCETIAVDRIDSHCAIRLTGVGPVPFMALSHSSAIQFTKSTERD